MKCEEVELGAEALEYIRVSLQNGTTFSHELLRAKDLAAGRVRALIPYDVTIEQIRNVASGMFPERPPEEQHWYTAEDGSKSRLVPIPDTDDCLVPIIRNFLAGGKHRICLLENALESPQSHRLSDQNLPIIVFEDQVYHVIIANFDDPEQVLQTIKDARSWLLNGALTMLPPGIIPMRGITRLETEQLSYLAEHAFQIVVSAYDGEGFLLWSET